MYNASPLEKLPSARQYLRGGIGEVESLDGQFVVFADPDEVAFHGEAGVDVGFEDNFTDAKMVEDRFAGERTEDVDNDRDPLRRRGARTERETLNVHGCCPFRDL